MKASGPSLIPTSIAGLTGKPSTQSQPNSGDDLLPDVLHDTTQYAKNRVEWDRGRLKASLRPTRGLRTDRTASRVIRGHAFVQNLRRGHYELGIEARHEGLRVAAAFDELATAI